MPLSVDSEVGYGSTPCGPGLGSSLAGHSEDSETAPLLIPVRELDPSPHWVPMSKKELEHVAGGPEWRKLRSCLVLLFWVSWLSVLGAAVAIVVLSPRPVAPSLRWWQKAPFYREQSALLLSSRRVEMGAVNGVHDRMRYLCSLGVGTLIVEGLFSQDLPTPGLLQPNSSLGALSQLQQILVEGSKAGLRILLDLCGLDLSDLSSTNLGNETGESETRTNPVELALRFLLEQGVAGVSMCDTDAAYSEHILSGWRVLLEEFSQEDNERIVIVKQIAETERRHNASGPSVNHSLVEIFTKSLLNPSLWPLSSKEVAVAVETSLSRPHEKWPSWTLGGSVSWKVRRILMVLVMTLPGPPVISYGEEVSQLQSTQKTARNEALELFHTLSSLRLREVALLFGNFTFLPSSTDHSLAAPPPVLGFLRSWGCVHFLILLNLSRDTRRFESSWASGLPAGGVFAASSGLDRVGLLTLETLLLKPEEAVVIRLLDSRTFS